MPARSGEQYIERLREHPPEVYLGGEQIKDVTEHPALANGVKTIASLYDLQSKPAALDEMTYVSRTSGDRVGLSFIVPKSVQHLEQRRQMMTNWARTTFGMMGRTLTF